VRLAYPEYSLEVREKIACAQFISTLTDSFIKVERSVAIKVIQKNSFSRRNESCFRETNNFVRENINKRGEKGKREGKEIRKAEIY